MDKCEECGWEGYKLGLHKSLKHAWLVTNTKISQAIGILDECSETMTYADLNRVLANVAKIARKTISRFDKEHEEIMAKRKEAIELIQGLEKVSKIAD